MQKLMWYAYGVPKDTKGGKKMNVNKLKSKMALNNISFKQLAQYLSICRASLYRKSHGLTQFTQKEISIIRIVLKLTDEEVIEIFFDEKVS